MTVLVIDCSPRRIVTITSTFVPGTTNPGDAYDSFTRTAIARIPCGIVRLQAGASLDRRKLRLCEWLVFHHR